MPLLTFGGRFAKTPKPGQPVDLLEVDDWRTVFESRHGFDAHAWPYVRYDDQGHLAQPVRVPVRGYEGTVACWHVFLDYDESNDHVGLLSKIEDIPDSHYLSRWAVVYPTKSGIRMVYRLTVPVLPDDYGPMVRSMALELKALTGMRVDPTTDQWHRCFRLPSVIRNDEKAKGPTWDAPYYFAPLITDSTIDPNDVGRLQGQLPWKTTATHAVNTDGRPDVEEMPPGRLKLYKKHLRNSRFRDYIFDGLQVLPGSRDQVIVAMAGEVVARCFGRVPETSAAEIYTLLSPVALAMEPDGSEPWVDKLWRIVQIAWEGEEKKAAQREEKRGVDLTQREVVLERMLGHLPPHIVPNDPAERAAFATRHICLQTASGVFALTESGEYTSTQLRASQLPAYFNGGLSYLDNMHFMTPQGKRMSGQDILNQFSTVVDDVRYVADTHTYSRLDVEGDRKIVKICPFALRSDLVETAEFDQEVGEWLESFHEAERLKLWLASALAIHRGPTSALFLRGPARSGKSMLALGIAEAFGTQPAAGAQAFHDFNGALTQTPVILIDEGLPSRRGGMDTADLFRSLITGAGISSQKKFLDSVTLNIPYRIIMAANSYDMVTDLIGKRSLGSDDMEAFRERIFVLEPGHGPANYLDRRGNMAFTAEGPKGSWIGGKCRLARHLIKLYQSYFEESDFQRLGRRMLVEGRQHPAFTLAFDLSGHGREVVEALTSGIDAYTNKKALPKVMGSLEISDGCAWVRKWAFSTANSEQPTLFAKALDRFCTDATKRSSVDMSVRHKINLTKLLVCAEALGLATKSLHSLETVSKGIA